ncbi:MAG: hypothetical protein D6776_07800 [Planctomycetota bacterium]|nr:MAG: hypothetical protein D6776_07800 [Planctomycetota bacterium]
MSRARRSRGARVSLFAFQDVIAGTTGVLIVVTLVLLLQAMHAAAPEPQPATRPTAAESASALREEIARLQAQLARLAATPALGPRQLERERAALREREQEIERARAQLVQSTAQRERLERALRRQQAHEQRRRAERDRVRQAIEQESARPRITLLGGERRGKRPLLVECSAARIVVAQVGVDRTARELARFEGADAESRFVAWSARQDPAAVQFVLLVRPDAVRRFQRLAAALLPRFDLGWDAWPRSRALSGRPQSGGQKR